MISSPEKKCRPARGGGCGREGQSIRQSRAECYGWRAIDDAVADLARQRIGAELALIESVWCDSRGVPVARAAGIDRDHFQQADLRLLWLATVVCTDAGASRDSLHRISEAALRAERYWSDTATIAPPFSMIWCRENLSMLAGREYFSAPVIRRNARRLIDLQRRQESARQHLADAMSVMSGDDAPATAVQTLSIPPMRVRAVA